MIDQSESSVAVECNGMCGETVVMVRVFQLEGAEGQAPALGPDGEVSWAGAKPL